MKTDKNYTQKIINPHIDIGSDKIDQKATVGSLKHILSILSFIKTKIECHYHSI